MNYCDFIDDILIRTASYLSPKDLVNLGLTCTLFGSRLRHINNLSLVEDTAKQMIETTAIEREREAVYPFYDSWVERWYMLDNSDNSSVTFRMDFCGLKTRMMMKKSQRMDKIIRIYCDCKRGGVNPWNLRFLIDGISVGRDQTASDLEVEDDDIIDCCLPQGYQLSVEFLTQVGATHLIEEDQDSTGYYPGRI